MKYIVVIPDGMGDKPVKALKGKTPLEAARTPNMDFFASRGVVGLTQNIPDGYTPGTDIGSMSVFGYDPRKYFTGRGPLEATVHGIELKPGDLAFRCNLVTTEGKRMKDFSADHISIPEAGVLIEALDKAVQKKSKGRVRFYPGKGTGYRHLMIVKNAEAALGKTVCAPPHDIMGQPFAKYLPKTKAARLLNELMEMSETLFKDHPVNRRRVDNGKGPATRVWLWGQGFAPKFPTYFKRYGFRGGVITAVDLLKGIAMHAGLDVIRVPGVTGYFDTNYVGKAEYAVNSLRSRDFVVIHVESTDEAGHIGDAKLKIKAIEDVDRWVLGTLRRSLREFSDYKLLLLPDHYTCVETRTHSSDPVPFLMYSSAHKIKGPKKFCERSATKTGCVIKQGHHLMDIFVNGHA